MSVSYNFSGKTVLVTGGSRGIGRALVENLAICGARVLSLSRTVDGIDNLKKEQPDLDITGVQCDISKWTSVKDTLKSYLPVDYLVNNAAIGILTPFGQITENEIDDTFDVNVKALINVSQEIANDWKTREIHGVVVNVSSQTSMRAIPNHTVYCASKAAVDAITRSMAQELGPHQIRVNAVNPTAILTDLGKLYWEEPSRNQSLTSRLPLHRLGEVQEVVDVIMYLLTDRCTLITGASIPVDAGFWAS